MHSDVYMAIAWAFEKCLLYPGPYANICTCCSYIIIIIIFESRSVVSDSLRPHGWYSPWNSPGQNTGVGSLLLLQGIFPTQGSNPGLLHCRWILYHLSHKGSPRILEWVAFPFSRGSSPPRNQTRVSFIVGGFFTNWAISSYIIGSNTWFVKVLRSIIYRTFWEFNMISGPLLPISFQIMSPCNSIERILDFSKPARN